MLGAVVFTIGRQSETYIAEHLRALAPSKTVVCSLSACDSPRWHLDIPVMELHRSSYRSIERLKRIVALGTKGGAMKLDSIRLACWLTWNCVEVVFCEYLQVAIAVSDVCRRLGIPIVAHAHGYDVTAQPKLPGWADRYATQLPLIEDIICASALMKEAIVEFGVPPERVHVVPCGTRISGPPVHRAAQPQRLKMIAVGRLVPKKGPLFLLESFRLLRNAGVNAQLSIIGDGPFQEPMRQYLRATRLSDSVHLLGELPSGEVRRHLREADVFMQHSVTAQDGDEEGVPVAILEAMAEGLPVVATAHAGIPDAVIDGQTGFLVSPGDSPGMAEKCLRLLADSELRQSMGAAGRDLVLRNFTIDLEIVKIRHVLARHWPEIANC